MVFHRAPAPVAYWGYGNDTKPEWTRLPGPGPGRRARRRGAGGGGVAEAE